MRSLAFSPNGALLATDTDSGIIIWDLARRQPLFKETGAESSPLVFDRVGEKLLAGRALIDVGLDSWRRRACSMLSKSRTGVRRAWLEELRLGKNPVNAEALSYLATEQ